MLVLLCGGGGRGGGLIQLQDLFIDSGYLWTKRGYYTMVKLLASFIDDTGKCYFHFMHDMTPYPSGLREIDGLQGTYIRSCTLN